MLSVSLRADTRTLHVFKLRVTYHKKIVAIAAIIIAIILYNQAVVSGHYAQLIARRWFNKSIRRNMFRAISAIIKPIRV